MHDGLLHKAVRVLYICMKNNMGLGLLDRAEVRLVVLMPKLIRREIQGGTYVS